MVVEQPGPIATRPLRWAELPDPEPGPREVRVAVVACGVCRTNLHLAEGDLTPRSSSPRWVPWSRRRCAHWTAAACS